jgi:hypothetical protein
MDDVFVVGGRVGSRDGLAVGVELGFFSVDTNEEACDGETLCSLDGKCCVTEGRVEGIAKGGIDGPVPPRCDGILDGKEESTILGCRLGAALGIPLGNTDGKEESKMLGCRLGAELGMLLGNIDGKEESKTLGCRLGAALGIALGNFDGKAESKTEGDSDGLADGGSDGRDVG